MCKKQCEGVFKVFCFSVRLKLKLFDYSLPGAMLLSLMHHWNLFHLKKNEDFLLEFETIESSKGHPEKLCFYCWTATLLKDY